MRKLHLETAGPSGPMTIALCGWTNVGLTTDASAVTCNRCRRRMRRAAIGEQRPTAPFAPGPALPVRRQDWCDPGPRVVRESIEGNDGAERVYRSLVHALREEREVRHMSMVKAASTQFAGAPSGASVPATIARVTEAMPVAKEREAACAAGRSWPAANGAPEVRISSAQLRGALDMYVAGKSYDLIAEALEFTTRATPRQWAVAIGEAMERIHVALVARGLLLDSPSRVPLDAVRGLKAIAEIMQVAPATAAKYAGEAPIRQCTARGHVAYWTREVELRAWMGRTRGPWTWSLIQGA